MKVELTEDSPILLKIIPETKEELFANGVLYSRMRRMNLRCLKPGDPPNDGVLILNIDNVWDDFTEHK